MGDDLRETILHILLRKTHAGTDMCEEATDAVLAAISERHVIVERVAPADLPKHLAEEIEGDLASLCLDEWLDDSAINALRGRMLGRVLDARSAPLEEAAKACDRIAVERDRDNDDHSAHTARECASAIRALIGGPR